MNQWDVRNDFFSGDICGLGRNAQVAFSNLVGLDSRIPSLLQVGDGIQGGKEQAGERERKRRRTEGRMDGRRSGRQAEGKKAK